MPEIKIGPQSSDEVLSTSVLVGTLPSFVPSGI